MLKKALLGLMTLCVVSFGFISCANGAGDDNSNSLPEPQPLVKTDYSSYYGTYIGSVMTVNTEIVVAKESVNQGGNYGSYTKVLWLTDTENKAVVAAQSDSTNTDNGDLTVENYKTASSCYIEFGTDGTATYFVPKMAKMMPNGATLSRSIAADVAGSYTVDETCTVNLDEDMLANMQAMGMSNSTSASGTTLKIDAVSGSTNKVNVTLPGITYESMSMTMPSFTMKDIVVSTSDYENYTFSLDNFDQTVTVIDDEGDEVEKEIKGDSISGALVKSTGKINFLAVYTYGYMPYSLNDEFKTSTSAPGILNARTITLQSANTKKHSSAVTPVSTSVSENEVSSYYGEWSGDWKIFGIPFPMTATVDADNFTFSSSKMSGSYEYVSWAKDSEGNIVCYGSHKAGKATESACAAKITFKADGYGYFWVRAMQLFSSPAKLSK